MTRNIYSHKQYFYKEKKGKKTRQDLAEFTFQKVKHFVSLEGIDGKNQGQKEDETHKESHIVP